MKCILVPTIVGYHHGDGSEERLQVVGQLGAARVPGVHRDEGRAGRQQLDLTALKHEAAQLKHANTDRQVTGQVRAGQSG